MLVTPLRMKLLEQEFFKAFLTGTAFVHKIVNATALRSLLQGCLEQCFICKQADIHIVVSASLLIYSISLINIIMKIMKY
jgi:hypothetical protein